MKNEAENLQPTLYLAPLQGFTDFVYREAYHKIFGGIDAYFIPYISVKNNGILRKYEKEILWANNQQPRVIPQILASDAGEALFLAKFLAGFGYSEINLNLGCPYPMVTNRKMGAGLLPFPEKIEEILAAIIENTSLKLSVKMRAGLLSDIEIEKVLPVLNQFPLTEVIFHPRIARQLYSGAISETALKYVETNLKHPLVYNGDITSVESFKNRLATNNIKRFMLGRGVLANPFLPSEIKGTAFTAVQKGEMLFEFHRLVLLGYTESMDNEGNVLNKMKQFWSYFSYNFNDQPKCFKRIKKTNRIVDFQTVTNTIFSKY